MKTGLQTIMIDDEKNRNCGTTFRIVPLKGQGQLISHDMTYLHLRARRQELGYVMGLDSYEAIVNSEIDAIHDIMDRSPTQRYELYSQCRDKVKREYNVTQEQFVERFNLLKQKNGRDEIFGDFSTDNTSYMN